MYDDWGNEIAVAEPVFPPPDHLFIPEIPAARPAALEDGLWDDMPIQARALSYEFTFSDADDAFVLPQGDGAESFGTKPGSYGHWLTPLSNNGEADLGEIVVTGVRPNPTTPGGWYNSDNDGSWDGHDTSEPWLPPVPPPPESPCELDQAKDSVAKTIAEAIKGKPDWNEREYGALILRDSSGYIFIGDIARGETVAEAQARATTAGQTSFAPETRFGSVPTGFTVVGVVHSHPDVGYNPSEDLQNHYPSDYAGGGDYTNFENLVGVDPRFSFAADFTQYILGPDGVLREFDFTEGRVNQTNDNRTNRSDLASDRPCD